MDTKILRKCIGSDHQCNGMIHIIWDDKSQLTKKTSLEVLFLVPLPIATNWRMNESSTLIIYMYWGSSRRHKHVNNYSPPIIRPDWPPISVQSIIASTSNVGFLVFPPLRVNPFTHMTPSGSLQPSDAIMPPESRVQSLSQVHNKDVSSRPLHFYTSQPHLMPTLKKVTKCLFASQCPFFFVWNH